MIFQTKRSPVELVKLFLAAIGIGSGILASGYCLLALFVGWV